MVFLTLKMIVMRIKTVRQFEKNRYKANSKCPCGKDNKMGRFATQKGFVGQPVGKCFGCGENFYLKNKGIVKNYETNEKVLPICSCDMQQVRETLDTNLNSILAQWMYKIIGEENTIKVIERYFLGVLDSSSTVLHNTQKKVIFWQIDRRGNVRAGKVMSYDSNGKRIGIPGWIRQKDCQLNQCFFGEHLIDLYEDLPIAVVESEKTACLMSYFNPSFIWIATGSAHNLQDWKCVGIEEFEVTLFPDHNQYDNWKKIAYRWDFEISKECELWFERGLIKSKEDIADYYLTLSNLVTLDVEVVKIDNEWSQEEYDSIFKNNENKTRD